MGLGSSGSVVPLFLPANQSGGTDNGHFIRYYSLFYDYQKRPVSYFKLGPMGNKGQVFVLDSERCPLRSFDLAQKMATFMDIVLKVVDIPMVRFELKFSGLETWEKSFLKIILI